ncbi:uncharacterized protein METZ01_LOCUS494525 [marine metagenome]|uniref:Uncharacterized protein n=1 Tax=marine metagenome TaxID=408172 RepID=A0A383DBD6_9ZZZZ
MFYSKFISYVTEISFAGQSMPDLSAISDIQFIMRAQVIVR